MLGEAELKRVKKGEIIQLQRKGFFRCDVPYAEASSYSFREQPLILFHIPDGHATITLPGTVDKTATKESKKVSLIQSNQNSFLSACIYQIYNWTIKKITHTHTHITYIYIYFDCIVFMLT
jgi:bifunctional glutamyl/prolyl-tRNA synthetase